MLKRVAKVFTHGKIAERFVQSAKKNNKKRKNNTQSAKKQQALSAICERAKLRMCYANLRACRVPALPICERVVPICELGSGYWLRIRGDYIKS